MCFSAKSLYLLKQNWSAKKSIIHCPKIYSTETYNLILLHSHHILAAEKDDGDGDDDDDDGDGGAVGI